MSATNETTTAPESTGPSPIGPHSEAERVARLEQLHDEEWEMAQKLLSTARVMLDRVSKGPRWQPSTANVAQILNLASKLGRLATRLEDKPEIDFRSSNSDFAREVNEAIQRVYSNRLPNEDPDGAGHLETNSAPGQDSAGVMPTTSTS